MHRILEYTLLFVIMSLLQIFLFNRIGISVYINPIAYIAFIILLPIEISGVLLLILALVLGMTMDLFMGVAGINTIAILFTAFCRPALLNMLIGKDMVNDGGIPNVNTLGNTKFIQYVTILTIIQCSIFFCLEALSWNLFYLTMFRIIISSATTIILVYFCQKLFSTNRKKI